jgi:hypothetical protein
MLGMIPVAMIAERLFWLRTILVQEWSHCPVVIGTLRNGCCCGLLSMVMPCIFVALSGSESSSVGSFSGGDASIDAVQFP